MKLFLLSITFIFSLLTQIQALHTAVLDGNWNHPSTWNTNTVPAVHDDVAIPNGRTVLLEGACFSKGITVYGTLQSNGNANFTLDTEWLLVEGSSANLIIGTASNPYTGRAIITLNGINDNGSNGGAGDKFISGRMQSNIHIHGKDKISWSQLGAMAYAGNNQITLKENIDWEIGDEIVIVSSRLDWNEAEKRTITAISTDQKTLTLDNPLLYPHVSDVQVHTRATDGKTWTADLRAEVGVLTHNITIQGDANSDTNGYGGHIMMHHGAKAYISGVELYRMGQKAILGRYPFHWHMEKNMGAGQYFKNSSVHKSFNRAITVHGTEYTLVENNFCYDHLGHGIFLEDGSERFNTIRKNVVLLSKRPAPGEELTPSDNSHNEVQNRTPSSYWITNPNNTFEDNVAAGTEGSGYWFAMPTSPMGTSASDPYFSGLQPHKEPLGLFKGNKAHSCMTGIDLFDQLNPDHSIKKNWGWDEAGNHWLEDCTWYGNYLGTYTGIGHAGHVENLVFKNNIYIDNRFGSMLASYSYIDETLIVANSGNNIWNGYTYAYRIYDGAGRMTNCHFVGWDEPKESMFFANGAARRHTNHTVENITFDHEGTPRINFPNFDLKPGIAHANDHRHPRVWNTAVRDIDGSVSGKANSTIVSNHPFMLLGDEYIPYNWVNARRSDRFFAYSRFHYDLAFANIPNVTITRTKPGTKDESIYYIDGYKEWHQTPVIVNEDFFYTYRYESLPSTKRVRMEMTDCEIGDVYYVRFTDFGKLSGLGVTSTDFSVSNKTSLNDVLNSATSAYYKEPNGDVYVKIVATKFLQTVTMSWTGSMLMPIWDMDGDEMPDGEEIANDRHPFEAQDLAAEYETNNDFEGWSSFTNISGTTVNAGNLKGTATNNGDAQIRNDLFNFKASDVPYIKVRLKSSINTSVQLFWSTETLPGYDANRKVTDFYSGNGEYQEFILDVGSHPDWSGTITSLRFDPVSSLGAVFEIDWIRAYVAPLPCEPTIATIPTTPEHTLIASRECTDAQGWTHYFDEEDNLLLSLQKNGQNIGAINDGTFSVMLGGVASALDMSYAPYVSNPNGWSAMGRYWNVIPTNQPNAPIGVRFYYTDNDFNQVKNQVALWGNTIANHEELYFYNVDNLDDPDPDNGHLGTLNSDYVQRVHGSSSLTEWTYASFNSDHVAEFLVADFSGGGAGAGGGDFDGAFLPVELLTLYGQVHERTNQIFWVTSSEENSKSFEIERSLHLNEDFEKIGELVAAGHSTESLSYDFIDENPFGKGYYRLKMIDLDGSFEYSNTILLQRETDFFEMAVVFPNPTKDNLNVHLEIDDNETGELEYSIFDVLGKKYYSNILTYQQGRISFSLDTSHLPPGIYTILLDKNGRKKIARKFIKVDE